MQLNRCRDYLELCKPRVVLLMLLTAIIGMLLAFPSGAISWVRVGWATVGIALTASAGAVLNHLIDRQWDAMMQRTEQRPVAAGRIPVHHALIFALILAGLGMFILMHWVNGVTAALTFVTLIGYGIIYTVFLKHATAQNIVIGGLAGAMPPLLGWTAVTGAADYRGWLLVLIIFTWTPPHFWALAIYRYEDYLKARIPMLPVVYGIPYTKLQILLYTLLLLVVSLLPFIVGMAGIIYLLAALILGGIFCGYALRLKYCSEPKQEAKIGLRTFFYSITYLALLFIALLVDHYLA